jgi:hypothetical protein
LWIDASEILSNGISIRLKRSEGNADQRAGVTRDYLLTFDESAWRGQSCVRDSRANGDAPRRLTRRNITGAKDALMNAKPASLQTFTLGELEQFTKEGVYSTNASKDFHLFYVGRDDVHDILKYLLLRVSTSLYLNMFGYDDGELNDQCMRCAREPTITTVVTLDKSQAGGIHEKAILASDVSKDTAAFNAHFAIGQSATSQISHTKGGVLDGKVGFEGSTN